MSRTALRWQYFESLGVLEGRWWFNATEYMYQVKVLDDSADGMEAAVQEGIGIVDAAVQTALDAINTEE